MPVVSKSTPHHVDHSSDTHAPIPRFYGECIEHSSRYLTIGLINNMADSALEATERQFISLLNEASGNDVTIRLELYSLPGVPRNGSAARRVHHCYSNATDLLCSHLDGLIVTGREPLTPNLQDEPYWESFTKVLEWARSNTYSAVWSCLAAHAAVLYQDGIRRVKSGDKYCGVFDCALVNEHPLTAGVPSRFKLPHSRWNGLPEEELTAHGYHVLTQACDAGVDTFLQQHRSLFVFFQGHPEYEPNTLQLEYRRDVGRFLRGEMATYPMMPRDYFDPDAAAQLTAFQMEATANPRGELVATLSTILENASTENSWRPAAASIYRNWLKYIYAQKRHELQARKAIQGDSLTGFADSPAPELAVAIH